jgi:hypothetical protein
MPDRATVRATEEAARKEIRKLLDGLGCPPDIADAVPPWSVEPDIEKCTYQYTGVLRVKVTEYRRTKMFVSNSSGKFKDLKKIAQFIYDETLARRRQLEQNAREAKRQEELEPVAEKLREEFNCREYSGDFRVQATAKGLNLVIDVNADEDQIRYLLMRAKELGMRRRNEGEEDPEERSTIFDRILEEEDAS